MVAVLHVRPDLTVVRVEDSGRSDIRYGKPTILPNVFREQSYVEFCLLPEQNVPRELLHKTLRLLNYPFLIAGFPVVFIDMRQFTKTWIWTSWIEARI